MTAIDRKQRWCYTYSVENLGYSENSLYLGKNIWILRVLIRNAFNVHNDQG